MSAGDDDRLRALMDRVLAMPAPDPDEQLQIDVAQPLDELEDEIRLLKDDTAIAIAAINAGRDVMTHLKLAGFCIWRTKQIHEAINIRLAMRNPS